MSSDVDAVGRPSDSSWRAGRRRLGHAPVAALCVRARDAWRRSWACRRGSGAELGSDAGPGRAMRPGSRSWLARCQCASRRTSALTMSNNAAARGTRNAQIVPDGENSPPGRPGDAVGSRQPRRHRLSARSARRTALSCDPAGKRDSGPRTRRGCPRGAHLGRSRRRARSRSRAAAMRCRHRRCSIRRDVPSPRRRAARADSG